MRLDTTIDSYLKNLIQPHFSFSSENLFEKDSREITDEDRDKLINAIESSPHNNIIITHGKFTMQQTAKYMDQRGIGNKKIILTGSMIPITGFSMSDAGFNLGFAIAYFASIEPGVYICMNGGLFHASEAEKNETLLRFE
jgi:L-asparaginase